MCLSFKEEARRGIFWIYLAEGRFPSEGYSQALVPRLRTSLKIKFSATSNCSSPTNIHA